MRGALIFCEAFLDGFTMSGLRKLHKPNAPSSLFAPEDEQLEAHAACFKASGEENEVVKQRRGVSWEIWVGKVEVRQLPLSEAQIKLEGVGAFTWVNCWAQDEGSFLAKVSEVMNEYGLFILGQEQVMPYAEAEAQGLIGDELAEQAEDTRADRNYCIYGTFYNYMSDN